MSKYSKLSYSACAFCVVAAIGVSLYVGCGPKAPPKDDPADISTNTTSADSKVIDDTDFDQLSSVEQMEQKVSSQLKKLAKAITKDFSDIKNVCDAISATPFSADLFTKTAPSIVRDANFTVRRLPSDMPEHESFDSLTDAWSRLVYPIAPNKADENRSKFKVVRVSITDETVTTKVIVSVFAKSAESSTEVNTTVNMDWNLKNGKPFLTTIRVIDHESVVFQKTAKASPVGFTDCTVSLVKQDSDLISQFSRGTEYWISRFLHSDYSGHHGLSVGDLNGDGLDDVYICQNFGIPNRLLLQNPDGTATDISGEWGVDILDQSRSALIVDIDNDGDQDLLVSAESFLLVFENKDNQSFELKEKLYEARNSYSLSAADFDLDGDLDLYACSYNELFGGGPFPFAFPFHDANNGGRNVLYQNDGSGNFHDATAGVGLEQDNTKFSFAAAWEDFDHDGDPDLYVANDFGRNCFYENKNGQFQNVAQDLKIEDQSFGMSVDWADTNHDGVSDLYISNMFSSAGNRISFQSGFMSRQPELQNRVQYMARGNSLFQGSGSGFSDVSIDSNVWLGRWAWSSKFVDLDNDSWDDIVVANGYLTRDIQDDL